ncbi:carbohydrate porin [Mucilaginibacter sp. RS28]|uniref:Carbohydrate porin n=1 Tax=Mucilaginibacter straminoryzae TaxID=2932774 RepID=A0A9X1X402_9SPHI|nr:carbohydrate porin [Mucilaginibacter straminoryzae]MCJ8210536.1 carbohydrate porin [Mucilaginibacter straminoryzae]
MNKTLLISLVTLIGFKSYAQQDTVKQQRFNFHFQQTVISQYKPSFNAKYSGANSLSTGSETQSSLTTTMFMGARLWKGAEFYFNPEMSGGAGLSKTLGIAGFPNGETFRVGSAEPKIYIARAYLNQNFTWGNDRDTIKDDLNTLAGFKSKRYFSITAGKFGMSDYFDGNAFSHDPRTQFMNWSLMSNGAWDYPANTRGYVLGLFTELGMPDWTLRFAYTMSTTTANGSIWDARIGKSNSQTLEFEKRYKLNNLPGAFRILGFSNNGKFGNYNLAVAQNPAAPDVDATQQYGRHKWGFGINTEQNITKDFGVFAKASYNDGKTETWFFTEIDRSVSFGGVLNGRSWKRKFDEAGLAFVGNGISGPHRNYLANGGYGFIIGDGKLNYGTEMIAELYYKIDAFQEKFFITPDYQFILHPAYNRDRGPVNVFSLRAHIEF